MSPSYQGRSQDGGRLRAYLEFLAAVILFFVARALAHGWAQRLAAPQWTPLVEQSILVVLLLLGYAGMGLRFDHQQRPISAQGLPGRPGWTGEAALGMAAGWAVAVACVLPLVVFGGIAIVLVLQPAAWSWLAADAVFFALAALAEEIAFRGYGFQRFVLAVGPLGASLGYAAFYAIVQALTPGSSHSSFAVSLALGLVLSTAYLRSGALWVSWGLNFGWKASRALIFGLAVSGVSNQSPVVQGNPMGPFWLTGGGFGLDASWWAFLVLLAALPVVYRLTHALNERYNTPEIIPGGIPVDLDAAARRQHEAAMGSAESAAPAPAASGLVQIQPIAAPASAPAAPPANSKPEP